MKSSISKHSFVVVVLAAMFGGFASSARAQSSISAGYQINSASQGDSRTTSPVGFYVDVAKSVMPIVAVVGEVGGVYHPFHLQNVTAYQYTYQVGLRFSGNMPAAKPYVQVLVGGAKDGVSGGPVPGTAQSAFSTQFGGGVDLKTSGPPLVRFGVDYRRIMFSQRDGGGKNDIRFVVGLTFPFGH